MFRGVAPSEMSLSVIALNLIEVSKRLRRLDVSMDRRAREKEGGGEREREKERV